MPPGAAHAPLVRYRLASCAARIGYGRHAIAAKLISGAASDARTTSSSFQTTHDDSCSHGIRNATSASVAREKTSEHGEHTDGPRRRESIAFGDVLASQYTSGVLRRVESGRRDASGPGSRQDVEAPDWQDSTTRQSAKKSRTHPSAYLLFALERIGRRDTFLATSMSAKDPFGDSSASKSCSKPSLQAVLARYILLRGDFAGSSASLLVADVEPWSRLPDGDRRYLEQRNYSASDLEQWTAAILAEDDGAVCRTLLGRTRAARRSLPVDLFLLLLRRRDINAKTLRCFLDNAWAMLEVSALRTISGSETRPSLGEEVRDVEEIQSNDIGSSLDNQTTFAIFHHLLRHARRVWPLAIENITKIVSSHICRQDRSTSPRDASEAVRFRQINGFCNRALVLLSSPASLEPVASTVYLESAQFDILHAMASHKPPLRIGHDAYKAVVSILLSRPKTERELDWASLQSKSWPPWKKSRTGIDEARDITYGFSRAVVAIHQMMQAGYGSYYWSRLAKLYGGWDTDGSPTVQTRRLLDPYAQVSDAAEVSSFWKARIATTRTIREAWACFLSYKQSKGEPNEGVYVAMITKLSLSERIAAHSADTAAGDGSSDVWHSERDVEPVNPGDSLVPLAEPSNALELTHVSSNPPTALELFHELLAKGVKISNDGIAEIVRHARSIEEGLVFLEAAGPDYVDHTRTLMSGDDIDSAALIAVPDSIFASFIRLLCRSPRTSVQLSRKRSTHDSRLDWSLQSESPVIHAMRLLVLRQCRLRGLWAALLEALGDTEAPLSFSSPFEGKERLAHAKLRLMGDVLSHMRQHRLEPDSAALRAVSAAMETAALAQDRLSGPEQRSLRWNVTIERLLGGLSNAGVLQHGYNQEKSEATKVAMQPSHFLRFFFQRILHGPESDDAASSPTIESQLEAPAIPRLLDVPNATDLHAYVRALGVFGDHEGILSLAQWMAEHHAEITIKVAEERAGRMHRWRILLRSIRVFLECPEKDSRVAKATRLNPLEPASQDLVWLVRREIESVQAWEDDWPSYESMRRYISLP